ncbi:unnamed protein product [Urochloa humidicola]
MIRSELIPTSTAPDRLRPVTHAREELRRRDTSPVATLSHPISALSAAFSPRSAMLRPDGSMQMIHGRA